MFGLRHASASDTETASKLCGRHSECRAGSCNPALRRAAELLVDRGGRPIYNFTILLYCEVFDAHIVNLFVYMRA